MKFGIQIYHKNIKVKLYFGRIEQFLSVKSYASRIRILQFPFIFFAEVAHTEMKLGIQIYKKTLRIISLVDYVYW
jgi:hypothetical protein